LITDFFQKQCTLVYYISSKKVAAYQINAALMSIRGV